MRPNNPPAFFEGIPVAGTYGNAHLDDLYKLDLLVGAVIDSLEERGLLENTIIVYTSDNGGLETEHTRAVNHDSNGPLTGYKRLAHLLEGGINVPLIIRYDGKFFGDNFPRGETRENLMSITDIFSTICDLVEIPIPEDQALDSTSAADFLISNDPAKNREYAFHYDVAHAEWNAGKILNEAIRWNNMKLLVSHFSYGNAHSWEIQTNPDEGYEGDSVWGGRRGNTKFRLIDLDADISEKNDLSDNAAYADTLNHMYKVLQEHTTNICNSRNDGTCFYVSYYGP